MNERENEFRFSTVMHCYSAVDVTEVEWVKGAFKLDECQYFGSENPFTSENTDPVNDVADEWDRFVAKLETTYVDVYAFLYTCSTLCPLYARGSVARVWCVYNGGTNSLSRAPPTPLSPARPLNGAEWTGCGCCIHRLLSEQPETRHFASYRLISPLIGLSLRFFILLNVDLIMGEG